MLKKFFALILISSVFNSNAFIDEHLEQLKNPKQISFADLDLCGANLSGLNLSNKVFTNVKFNGASFEKTKFINTTFIKCNFVDTILNNTTIVTSIFVSCNMQKVYMFSAQFNSATFDPSSSAGIIFE